MEGIADAPGAGSARRLCSLALPHGLPPLPRPIPQESGASDAELAALKKRKLVQLDCWKTYRVGKGPAFALQRRKAATELTAEMLQK